MVSVPEVVLCSHHRRHMYFQLHYIVFYCILLYDIMIILLNNNFTNEMKLHPFENVFLVMISNSIFSLLLLYFLQMYPSIVQSFMVLDPDIVLEIVYEQIAHRKIQNRLPI